MTTSSRLPDARPGDSVPNIAAGKMPRILLLEDEAIILMDMMMTLQDAGFIVDMATTVDLAMDHITAHPPDAAVLDINLGGQETCAEVAKRLKAMDVPFVVHSGDLDRRGEDISTIAGDAQILPKPLQIAKLVAVLKDLIAA